MESRGDVIIKPPAVISISISFFQLSWNPLNLTLRWSWHVVTDLWFISTVCLANPPGSNMLMKNVDCQLDWSSSLFTLPVLYYSILSASPSAYMPLWWVHSSRKSLLKSYYGPFYANSITSLRPWIYFFIDGTGTLALVYFWDSACYQESSLEFPKITNMVLNFSAVLVMASSLMTE